LTKFAEFTFKRMTLNGVIALIWHFFTEFDSFAGQLRHSGWR